MKSRPASQQSLQSIPQSVTSAWSMYRAIVGIGTLCALVIVGVYQATASRILENQQRFLNSAIAQVLPSALSTIEVTLHKDGKLERALETSELPVFLAYDSEQKLVGAIITAEGMGYQDNIRVLYAYSFDLDAITGLKVLDSKETPGLGDRVEKEPHFIANFVRLDAQLTSEGNALMHEISTVKQGEKTKAWQIDGITGATITSEAIGRILNNSAAAWIPALEHQATSFSNHPDKEEP